MPKGSRSGVGKRLGCLDKEGNILTKVTTWGRDKGAQRIVIAGFYMGSNDRFQV